jgi:hypothetical protein
MRNRVPQIGEQHGNRYGFTWIELIGVLLASSVVVALVIPAIQQSREAARISTCKNNLKQFGLGLHNYHEAYKCFPHGCVGNPELPPEKRWSWYTFFGHQMAQLGYPKIDLNRSWDDPSIRPLLQDAEKHPGDPKVTMLLAYPNLICPSAVSRSHSDGQPFTDYVGLGGVGEDGPLLPRTSSSAGAWAYEMVTTQNDVSDGMSHTVFMLDTAKDNGCWLAGGPATVRPFIPTTIPAVGIQGQFGGIHPKGGVALFMDGKVQVLAKDMDEKVFSALATIAGKEEPVDVPGE